MKRNGNAEEYYESVTKRLCTLHPKPAPVCPWLFNSGDQFNIVRNTEIFALTDRCLHPVGNVILYNHPYVVQTTWLDGKPNGLCIVVNPNDKSIVRVYTLEDGKVKEVVHTGELNNKDIDMTHDGGRWSGNCSGNTPCGWGAYYDGNNMKLYEGFGYMNYYVCYGSFYSNQNGTMRCEYQGMHCFGDKMGGRCTDVLTRRCNEWLNNGLISQPDRSNDLYQVLKSGTRIQKILVDYGSTYGQSGMIYQQLCNMSTISFSYLLSLEELSITMQSPNVKEEFAVSHCYRLKHLVIGQGSFDSVSTCLLSSRVISVVG